MKRKFRLLKNEDFKKVMSKKNYFHSKEFSVFISKNDKENNRFGISVSSKIGNSVIRHKVKRQIDSIIYNNCFDILEEKDVVIIVRKPYLDNKYEKNKENLINKFFEIKKKTENKNEKKV